MSTSACREAPSASASCWRPWLPTRASACRAAPPRPGGVLRGRPPRAGDVGEARKCRCCGPSMATTTCRRSASSSGCGSPTRAKGQRGDGVAAVGGQGDERDACRTASRNATACAGPLPATRKATPASASSAGGQPAGRRSLPRADGAGPAHPPAHPLPGNARTGRRLQHQQIRTLTTSRPHLHHRPQP